MITINQVSDVSILTVVECNFDRSSQLKFWTSLKYKILLTGLIKESIRQILFKE